MLVNVYFFKVNKKRRQFLKEINYLLNFIQKRGANNFAIVIDTFTVFIIFFFFACFWEYKREQSYFPFSPLKKWENHKRSKKEKKGENTINFIVCCFPLPRGQTMISWDHTHIHTHFEYSSVVCNCVCV